MSGTKSAVWFWSDWLSDPGVRASSLAARGLWMDMLCYMAQADGYLEIAGQKVESADLARLVQSDLAEVERLLAELQSHGVFSVTRDSTIYSRRLTRKETNRRNGRLGGLQKALNDRLSNEVLNSSKTPSDPPSDPSDVTYDKSLSEKADQNSLAKKGYPLSSLLPSPSPELRSTNVDLLLKPERFERASASDWPIDFEEQFWAAYPRKVGKKAALAKLERVRRSGEVAFAVLMAEVRRIKRDEPQFIPHPMTWLNQGRYLDNAAPTASEEPAYLRPPPGCRSLEEIRREYRNREKLNGGTQIRRDPGMGKARPG